MNNETDSLQWARACLTEVCYGRKFTSREILDVAEELRHLTTGGRCQVSQGHRERRVAVYHATTADDVANTIMDEGFKAAGWRARILEAQAVAA